jgi:hypothetical protein
MAYGLSFSDSFFFGEAPLDEMETSDKPTSVLQAIISMEREASISLALEVFGETADSAPIAIDAEDWPYRVLERIKETDTCGDLSSPVDVWIDEEGWWTLDIYE